MSRAFVSLCLLLLSGLWQSASARERSLPAVPQAIASTHFMVTINGQSTPVFHAANNLYFLNFAASRRTSISVTAPSDDFWASGVEVQPWRLGIRPVRHGRTISFVLDGPAKVTLSRPGDFLQNAEMLYLFANAPEINAPTRSRRGLRYFGSGVHTQNIDAQTGESIYLAPGAVVFGALNVWGVDHVRVFGRGVIVYDGPQDATSDTGWQHRRNWHCIVMDNAHEISVEGITCVVRSRTWQIQMKDSRNVVFDNVKVIGANSGNANADGMDWLGGGDTVIRNSFFRAADDVFAMQSSWEGYGPAAFAVQGKPVTNIQVESSIVSTSISNIVRAAWPQKNFEGGNFLMSDTDVLHMGLGGCGIPFALMEVWAYPEARGKSSGFSFNDIRLDDWYSLVQLRQAQPGAVRGVHFTDIASLGAPSLVPSLLQGDVKDVTLDNVTLAGRTVSSAADVPLQATDGAEAVAIHNTGPPVDLTITKGWLRPGHPVHFEATPQDHATALDYTWIFGDGTQAHGRKVDHRFGDAQGTLLDGSGLYRVLLHVASQDGRNTWMVVPTVVRDTIAPASTQTAGLPGVAYRYQGSGEVGPTVGSSPVLSLADLPKREAPYTIDFDTSVDIPDDGGYVFTLLANDGASLAIDGHRAGKTPAPFAQVCGLAGNAAQQVTVAVELAKGLHRLQISERHNAGEDDLQLLWQGPGIPQNTIPASSLFLPTAEAP